MAQASIPSREEGEIRWEIHFQIFWNHKNIDTLSVKINEKNTENSLKSKTKKSTFLKILCV